VLFNTRRTIALVVVLLGSSFGGLLAMAFSDWRFAGLVGMVLGAVVGVALVLIWANQSH
jgi:hypothetical protein